MMKAVFALLCCTAIAAAQDNNKDAIQLPDGNGKQLVLAACQRCHTLSRIVDAELWTYQWRETVQNMIGRGAALNPEDAEIVVQYLAKNFRPSGASRPRVELPEGSGKNIVVKACQSCHSLRRITPMHLSASDWRKMVETMVGLGAAVGQDDLETVVKYLAQNFGPGAKP